MELNAWSRMDFKKKMEIIQTNFIYAMSLVAIILMTIKYGGLSIQF